MPRWICPNCNATMNVKPNLVGTMQACVKCANVSQVADSDDTLSEGPVSPFPSAPLQTHGLPVHASTITRIRGEAPTLIRVYRIGALLVVGLVVALNLVVYANVPERLRSLFLLLPSGYALIVLSFFWLWTDFVSDVYRCRRLLEEIAKK